jgi:uncharacterized damage-inducible protein DinB
MSDLRIIQRLHQHRVWVTSNLLDAASSLTDEQLRQVFAVGQGSVWRSLLHMLAAEYVWLEALLGNDDCLFPGDVRGKLPGNQLDGGIQSFAELRETWRRLDERWLSYLNGLTPESLDQMVYRISSSINPGQRLALRRSDVLVHVCTHAHYTATQVVNMLRQLGVEKLPETMLISLARREVAG